VLRGADMSGTEFACVQGRADPFGGQPEDDARTFAAMHTWGITVVRIPLNEDCWLGINHPSIGGAAYTGPVTKLLRDLEASGFDVIVDLHWSAPGAKLATGQNTAPDQDHSPAFWSSVAGTFKTDSQVLFDLYNEPHPHDSESDPTGSDPYGWKCWAEGCNMTGGWRAAGMQTLVNSVRATGAKNAIMVGGNGWANDLSGWMAFHPSDPIRNLVASWHVYSFNGNSTGDADAIAVAAQYPLIVGETGDNTSGPVSSFFPGFLDWCDTNGFSYLAWTWNAWSNPQDVLVTDMRAGTPTSGEGATYKAHLAAVG
jgi:endoglucanase